MTVVDNSNSFADLLIFEDAWEYPQKWKPLFCHIGKGLWSIPSSPIQAISMTRVFFILMWLNWNNKSRITKLDLLKEFLSLMGLMPKEEEHESGGSWPILAVGDLGKMVVSVVAWKSRNCQETKDSISPKNVVLLPMEERLDTNPPVFELLAVGMISSSHCEVGDREPLFLLAKMNLIPYCWHWCCSSFSWDFQSGMLQLSHEDEVMVMKTLLWQSWSCCKYKGHSCWYPGIVNNPNVKFRIE